MRVLHILNELQPSGAETMLRTAAPHWRKRNIDGTILATGAIRGPFAEALEQCGYTIHHRPFRRSVRFLWEIWRFFRDQRCDAIHIHSERGSFWYAFLAFCAGHRRIARSVHGWFNFRGMLRLRRGLQRWILRRCFGVRTVAVSPAVRELEWERFHNPAVALLNWFDDTRFRVPSSAERDAARATLDISPHAVVLLTVGNCTREKNHAAVIRALARISSQLHPLYLHVGFEEAGRPERALAAECGVAARTRFLGGLDNVETALRAADIFLMPSLHEAFGIAAVEAMGAGVPVILADVAGLRDVAALAPDALCVTPTPEALADAIQHLASMPPEQRTDLGRRLSEEIVRQCAAAAGAERYADFYGELVRV